jgi:Uma2 family endonuclease
MVNPVRIRMTAAEFMALPETSEPQELIDGEVVMSPAPKDRHQDVVGNAYTLLRGLSGRAGGGAVRMAPLDVHLDESNVVQPDVFWVSGESDRCRLGEDGYWHGPPDLVIEVLSPSTARFDRTVKFLLYEKHAIREYWIIQPDLKQIEVWALDGVEYALRGTYTPGDAFESPALNSQSIAAETLFGA